MRINVANLDWNSTQPELGEWYASFLGRSMLQAVNLHLETLLQPVFGYQQAAFQCCILVSNDE